MRTSLAVLLFGAAVTVSASHDLEKRYDTSAVSAASAKIESLKSSVIAVPSNVAPDFTNVPASVAAAITNPAAIASMISEFATDVPTWYESLSPAAQSYVLNIGPKILSIQPEIASLQSYINSEVGEGVVTVTVTGNTTTTVVYPSVTDSSNSTAGNGSASFRRSTATSVLFVNSTQSSGDGLSTTSDVSTTPSAEVTSTSVGTGTSSSTAAAAQQTVALAAGMMGALGMLGLAIVL